MGNNVDLIDMLGLPESVQCPRCSQVIETYFEDHDIESPSTTFSKGHWKMRMYCPECDKDFQCNFKIKIEAKIET